LNGLILGSHHLRYAPQHDSMSERFGVPAERFGDSRRVV